MSNGTLFYVCGSVLAGSAVAMSFAGLRFEKFPGRFGSLAALWFVTLIGATTTFAVLHARDEQGAKAAELSKANEEVEEEQASPVRPGSEPEGATRGEAAPKPQPSGKGGEASTLQLAADPTQIAFDTTQLSSKPGRVTIELTNPSALEHDVGIERDGKLIAVSKRAAKGKTSVSADLAPGTYTFLCTVPGHAEAGMEGTLTVR